ncbi:DUF2202 domain-containing protein [Sulfurimonas sp. HSL3-7]|uniref:DUF2202 domain-containing protein n=1 Tax=Sulfonitrofixus jiaomeiensis TaxID=3131938 RepID=UPI0031F8226F
MFKKTMITSAAVAAILLTGCNSSEESTASVTDITVERGPVLGALVLDNSGQRGVAAGNGVYRFAKGVQYPVTVNGGYIDTNRNNRIDVGEARLGFELAISKGSAVTLVNTVASNSEVRTMLQEKYGLDDDRINNATPGNDREIAAISDELYAYCNENVLEPLKLQTSDLEQIDLRIKERLRDYNESDSSVAELEEELIAELGIETLTEDDLPQAEADLDNAELKEGNVSDTLPAGELNDAQKEGLVFMVEEEKLARDVYEYLYTKWDLTIFSNIAKSEQQHMDSVIELLEKYDLDYSASLQTRGSFENAELQSLYDTLTIRGEASVVEALEVGKLIEEVDIEDLEGLVAADIPEDLKVVYENLLKGSYNHLSAFTNQLNNY